MMKKKFPALLLLLPLFLTGCNITESSSSIESTTTTTTITTTSDESSSSFDTEDLTNETSQTSEYDSEETSSDESTTEEITSEATTSEESTIAVTSVYLDKESLYIYLDDTSIYLRATVLPQNATNKDVTWSSSNNNVAKVDEGKITPLNVGSTTITVKTVDGNKTASCNVTVKERVVVPNYVLHGLFNGDSDWTDKQMTQNPSASSEYMIQGVKLYSNDIFKVHMYGDTWYGYSALKKSVKSGLVTRGTSDDNIKVLTTGIYDIYSNYNESDGGHIYLAKVDGGGEDTSNPGVVSVTGVSLDRTGKMLTHRITDFYLYATVYPENATNKEVTWSSSNTSIASVTSAGRVITYEKSGTATITVKTVDGNKTAECLIYVSASGIPDYYLSGKINGRDYSAGTYTYAALPISATKYLIPDVNLKKGDALKVRGNNGKPAILKDKYNHDYVYNVNKDMSVNIYLNPNDDNYNYLSIVEK